MISRTQLEKFARTYIDTIENKSVNISQSYRILLFPTHLATPHVIKCTISTLHGVAIEFSQPSEKWKVETTFVQQRIDDVTLPRISDKGVPVIQVGGTNNAVSNINWITREFYDKYEWIIVPLSRATNFLLEPVFNKFVEVSGGDLRLVDVGLAYVQNGKDVARRIPFLWLFASNLAADYSPERAQQLGLQHYAEIVNKATQTTSIQLLVGTLSEYRKLLDKPDLVEQDMQTFLEHNTHLIDPAHKRKWDKGELRGLKMPEADFVLKTADGRFVVIELESPNDKLLTNERPPGPSKELRSAETQMTNYLSDIQNGILNYKNVFDRDISVESVSGQVIIGRSSNLSEDHRKALEKHVSKLNFSVITYDELYERSKTFLDNLGLRYGGFKTYG